MVLPCRGKDFFSTLLFKQFLGILLRNDALNCHRADSEAEERQEEWEGEKCKTAFFHVLGLFEPLIALVATGAWCSGE